MVFWVAVERLSRHPDLRGTGAATQLARQRSTLPPIAQTHAHQVSPCRCLQRSAHSDTAPRDGFAPGLRLGRELRPSSRPMRTPRMPPGAGGQPPGERRAKTARFSGGQTCLALLAATLLLVGCSPSTFLAHRMLAAPNRVPDLIKPEGRVWLRWPEGALERFPSGTNIVGAPAVGLRWVLIEPADFHVQQTSTNVGSGRRAHTEFTFRWDLPATGLPPARTALGTVFVLHGYGVDLDCLFPWAIHLAQAGWRSVLVDWRGHGRSGGRTVSFGLRETNDIVELRRALEQEGRVSGPYLAAGHSMGAALALRWATVDPALRGVVALGPYARLVPAAERLRDDYARWVPRGWVRRAAQKLPGLLGVEPSALDTLTSIEGRSVTALLVASAADVITPPEDCVLLGDALGPGSGFLIVGGASHETLPYVIDQHGGPVSRWMAGRVGATSVVTAGGTHGKGRPEGGPEIASGKGVRRGGTCRRHRPAAPTSAPRQARPRGRWR